MKRVDILPQSCPPRGLSRVEADGSDGFKCRYCGKPIYGSMGFLHAGDLVRHFAGEIEAREMRITCGECDARTSFDPRVEAM